ncbi:MAG: PspA/IM30 family protein [Candidatus Dormibacterales bacterium]
MSLIRRMSDVVGEKISAMLSRAEDPNEALDFAYQKQVESLQQVRRSVADVLTSEKRLELQAAQLQQSQSKLQDQAKAALAQGREDLARLALTRSQAAQTQLQGLSQQIQQLKDQEQKLELTAQKLQAKVDSFRTQKETIKAQYSAAEASTKIGEAVTGLSEQMADVSLMVDRAQDKTTQMQARASAIDQLVDTGVLDQIGAGSSDDIDRQLEAAGSQDKVEAQLAAMKQSLSLPAGATPALGSGRIVVRIQGEDQYSLDASSRGELDGLDQKLVDAIKAGDEPAFKGALAHALAFVHEHGSKLEAASLSASDVVLPAGDMSLAEATKIMEGAPSPAQG